MKKADLTVDAVRAKLNEARSRLDAAQIDLSTAQIELAVSWVGGRSPGKSTETTRTRIAQLEDAIAGLEALLPVAEHRELQAKIQSLENLKSQRAPRISELRQRLSVLRKETDLLPPEAVPTFLAGGEKPAEHPNRTELRQVLNQLRELESSDDYADLEIKSAQARCAEIGTQRAGVLSMVAERAGAA